MGTPLYNTLIDKVRDWANKPEAATIATSVIEDCLQYSADECYRKLRIPPLETTVEYTISAADNYTESTYGHSYTSFPIPEDLTDFIMLRTTDQGTAGDGFVQTANRVFNEITDSRTFFDVFAETNSAYYWMWKDANIYIRPQLPEGAIVEISHYRRLPALDALYSVDPVNYLIGTADANQPYLNVGISSDTALYFAGAGLDEQAFSTYSAAAAYGATQPITMVTTKYFTGKEVPNWLRDQNERLLLWGALYNLGAFLFDDKMEMRYEKKFSENIESMNKEEKFRRARGGNVQVKFNTNQLI